MNDADADVVAGALLLGGAQFVGSRGRQPEVGFFPDETACDAGGQVRLAEVYPGHGRSLIARRQEDVDAVIDDDGDLITNHLGHLQHLSQEESAVGTLGAQLDAGDSAVDSSLNGGQDVSAARAALALIGDEVNRQVRCGPHAGPPSAAVVALVALTLTFCRSCISRAYRTSRKAGGKDPGPVDRASARSAAAL